MNNLLLNVFLLLSIGFALTACGGDDEMEPLAYAIPSTYNFENVSYTGQTHRLAMLTEWKTYMATASSGAALDAAKMKAMFANAEGAGFSQVYTKQIKSKTFEAVQADFDKLIEALALTSMSTVSGSENISGVIESLDGEKKYLVAANGLDYPQLIEKGLMGACFYYQGTTVYLGSDRMDVDNETVELGEGTAMEHHWDEAFGYVGVQTDFPTNLDILSFWGNYSNQRNAVLGSNQTLMDAFLKGRAAISNKDLTTRDEAVSEVRTAWENIAVGSALHYLNSGIANFEDMALRSHALSEAIGFIYALQFNETRQVDIDQINELLTLIAGASTFEDMNLYQTDIHNLETAKALLATSYGFEAIQNDF